VPDGRQSSPQGRQTGAPSVVYIAEAGANGAFPLDDRSALGSCGGQTQIAGGDHSPHLPRMTWRGSWRGYLPDHVSLMQRRGIMTGSQVHVFVAAFDNEVQAGVALKDFRAMDREGRST
jgi:hypothetical protein